MMPHIESQVQRDALIADCKEDIERLEKSLKNWSDSTYTRPYLEKMILRNKITLAALEAEPDYFINRIEHTDNYGPEVELRAYESQLDAFKSMCDFGGRVVAAYEAPPAPAINPVTD